MQILRCIFSRKSILNLSVFFPFRRADIVGWGGLAASLRSILSIQIQLHGPFPCILLCQGGAEGFDSRIIQITF